MKIDEKAKEAITENDDELSDIHSQVNSAYANLEPKIKCKFCDEKFKLYDDMVKHVATAKDKGDVHATAMKALRSAVKNKYAGITAPIREEAEDLINAVDRSEMREIVSAARDDRGSEVQSRFQDLVCQKIRDAISCRTLSVVKEMFVEGKTWKDRRSFQDVADYHQTRIAKQTLRMNDPMAAVMGGMSKDESRDFLRKKGWSDKRLANHEAV